MSSYYPLLTVKAYVVIGLDDVLAFQVPQHCAGHRLFRHTVAVRPQGHDVGHVEIISAFAVRYVPVEPSAPVRSPHHLRHKRTVTFDRRVFDGHANAVPNTRLLDTDEEILRDFAVFRRFVLVAHLREPRAQRERVDVQYAVQVDRHDVLRLDVGQLTCVIRHVS